MNPFIAPPPMSPMGGLRGIPGFDMGNPTWAPGMLAPAIDPRSAVGTLSPEEYGNLVSPPAQLSPQVRERMAKLLKQGTLMKAGLFVPGKHFPDTRTVQPVNDTSAAPPVNDASTMQPAGDPMQLTTVPGDSTAVPAVQSDSAALQPIAPALMGGKGGSQKATGGKSYDSPSMLDRRRRMAESLMGQGMDTSPIASPWQGAARLADALVGGMGMKRADQQELESRKAATDAFMQSVDNGTGGMNTQSMAAILSNPWASPEQQQVAGKLWEMQQQRLMPNWQTVADPGTGNILRYNANDPNATPQPFFQASPQYEEKIVNGRIVRTNKQTGETTDITPANMPSGYRPATPEERQRYGAPEGQALVIGPDGKPTTLGPQSIQIFNDQSSNDLSGLTAPPGGAGGGAPAPQSAPQTAPQSAQPIPQPMQQQSAQSAPAPQSQGDQALQQAPTPQDVAQYKDYLSQAGMRGIQTIPFAQYMQHKQALSGGGQQQDAPQQPDMSQLSPDGQLHGDAFLKTLKPEFQNLVKGIAEGRQPFPTNLRADITRKIQTAVLQYDPNFNSQDFNSRLKTRTDFTSGNSARNITALNTALYHADNLDRAIDALHNKDYPLYNQIANPLAEAFGDTKFQAARSTFDTEAAAVANELTKVFKGTGATSEQEIQDWRAKMNSASTPAQLHSALQAGIELLKGRLNAVAESYNRGMGSAKAPMEFLDPNSQKIFQRLDAQAQAAEAPDSNSGAPAPQAQMQPSQSAQIPTLSPEDAAKLPPGTQFKTIDGRTMVKH